MVVECKTKQHLQPFQNLYWPYVNKSQRRAPAAGMDTLRKHTKCPFQQVAVSESRMGVDL